LGIIFVLPLIVLIVYVSRLFSKPTSFIWKSMHGPDLHLSMYLANKPNFLTLPPSVVRHIAWNEEMGAARSNAGARSKQLGFNSNQPIATNTR